VIISSGRIGGERYSSTIRYHSPVMAGSPTARTPHRRKPHEDRPRAGRTRLADGALRATTLAPGTETRALVTFDLPDVIAKMSGQFAVTVAVDVGGTIHRFGLAAYRD
jgi:hypothetical protein